MSNIVADLNWLASAVESSGGGQYREYEVVHEAIGEIERLRGIIRSCVHGLDITYLGDGEVIGLHRPNKEGKP